MNPPDIYKRNKCVVHGCTNYTNFAGSLCTPCHMMITTGKVGTGMTFIHDIMSRASAAREWCEKNHSIPWR